MDSYRRIRPSAVPSSNTRISRKVMILKDVLLYGVLGAIVTISLIGQERERMRDAKVDLAREVFQAEVREFMNRGDRFTAAQARKQCEKLSKHSVILGEGPLDCDELVGDGE